MTPPDEVRGARLVRHLAGSGVDLHELARDRQPRRLGITPLVNPDPVRFMRHELRALWQANLVSLGKSAERARPGTVPIGGPYRLLVVPSFRGHEAGTVAIQGMPDKQIEMLTPSFRVGGTSTRPIVAVWLYHDQSLAIAYVDFQGTERYILWHAPNAQQFTFAEPGELNHMAFHLGLEAPDQLDRALSKKFQPRNPTRVR